ncbi:hypothetical protein [Trichothermofontia sp.]
MKKRWWRWLQWLGWVMAGVMVLSAIETPVTTLRDRLSHNPLSLSLMPPLPILIPAGTAQEAPGLEPPPPDPAPASETPVTSPPLTEAPEPTEPGSTEPGSPDAIVPAVPEPTESPPSSGTFSTETPTTDSPSPLPLPEQTGDTPNVTPLPVTNTYIDANARFRVGIVQGYRVSPLAGSVLMEAPDGTLAYTVVVQPLQRAAFDHEPLNDFALAQVAQSAFARGEGFTSTAIPVALPTGGIQVNWTGTLTIAGQTQPVQGVILARQTGNDVLLLLIAGAQAGIAQIPNAVAALIDTFQPLL